MNQPAVRLKGVSKRYGDTVAVKDLDLEIAAGEVFGVLGPNGSGKTTTILMVLGLTEPDGGEISVLGLDPRRQPLSVKRQVGYLPDAIGFYDELSGRENLRYTARLNGMEPTLTEARIADALARIGLSNAADRPVGGYSRGMRQRLGLADLLLKQPSLVILDEPTLGLDPRAADEFLDLIVNLKGEGVTVMLSSHLLHQVQSVCDRVGLFSAGEMRVVGKVAELSERVIGGSWRFGANAKDASAAASLRQFGAEVSGVSAAELQGTRVVFYADRDVRAELMDIAVTCKLGALDLYQNPIDLDEVYATFYAGEDSVGQA